MDQLRYVYMLSTYEEDGSKEVVATFDRSKLQDLLVREQQLETPVASPSWQAKIVQGYADDRAGLDELLKKPDADLAESRAGHNLSRGWGGFQLHVIVLE